MEISKCLGCMEPFRGYPCPDCGYNPKEQAGAEYALPGETILAGKYLVGRLLGQGGFGMTYIGWDIALERKVAIKEYYPAGQVSRSPGTKNLTWYTSDNAQAARQEGMQMFLKEARKMSKLDDIPGIVRVRDLFQENGTAYIVMDFVEGETLKNRLQRTGPMSWEQAQKIFRPAIRAMEAVHGQGVIHRDLSPDNLMLTKNGGVRILDLGAAKDLNINTGASSMQVAKAGFSPLEQYTQRGGSGTWTDVYSMAATVYYTLTGKLPPNAVDRVGKDKLDWNFSALQSLPPAALRTLKKAMALTVDNRLQTMEELEKGLFGSAREKAARPAGKNGGKAMTAVALAVLLCAGALGAKYALGTPDSGWLQAARETQGLHIAGPSIAASSYHTVGVCSDGRAVAVGDNGFGACDVGEWTDIVSVTAGTTHTAGLRSNGTVVAAGGNGKGQCDVGSWTNIAAVSAGGRHTVGLRDDGTVIAVGDNTYGQCDVSSWTDIIAVSAGSYYTVGLRSDGTAVAVGNNESGQCDVSSWTDVVAVSAGFGHTVGLRSDGTVVAVGKNEYGQCDAGEWTDIVAVAARNNHTLGLRSNGTVAAIGYNNHGQCDVDNWTDIVALATGTGHTVGLRSNGTMVAVGDNKTGQCNVSGWKNIRVPKI